MCQSYAHNLAREWNSTRTLQLFILMTITNFYRFLPEWLKHGIQNRAVIIIYHACIAVQCETETERAQRNCTL